MMLSFVWRSLSRQGKLILKGVGAWQGRGWGWRLCGIPANESELEDTALSWVTSWLQRAGGVEVTGRQGDDSGGVREQMGEVWSHLRLVEEFEATESMSELQSSDGDDEAAEALQRWCWMRKGG